MPGWDGCFEISNMGMVRNMLRPEIKKWKGKILRPVFDKDCYLKVSLQRGDRRESYRINRLVAMVFIPNPDNKPIVDHINGVRWDNRVENLRWVSAIENVRSSYNRHIINPTGKAVLKCDKEGVVIKKYDTISQTREDGYNPRNVNKVVRGQRPFHRGFIWKYED